MSPLIRHRVRPALLLALAVVCAVALVPLAASGAVTAAASGGSISGTVREDGTGTALGGITVRLWVQTVGVWGLQEQTTSLGNGAYAFTGLLFGKAYAVEFIDPTGAHVAEFHDDVRGADPASAGATSFTIGSPLFDYFNVDADLAGAGGISGAVIDSGASPLAGVTVNAYRYSGGSFEAGVSATTMTAGDGTYRLGSLTSGDYGIQFFKGGYVEQYYSTVVTAGVTQKSLASTVSVISTETVTGIDATMLRAGRVAGTVKTSAGIALEAVTIEPFRWEGQWVAQPTASAVSDNEGRFTTNLMAPGLYRVRLTKGGYPQQYHRSTIAVDMAADVIVSEAATTTLATVMIASDSTAPNTTASGIPGGWATADVTVTLSASDGAAGSGVAATYYRLGASAPARYFTPVVVSAEGTTQLLYNSVDGFGNAETTKTAEVRIDRTPPESTCTAPAGWVSAPVTVSVSAADAISGVATTHVGVGGAAPSAYGGPFVVSGDGTTTVEYLSWDIAGNSEQTRTAHVRVDTLAPVTTDDALSGAQGATVTVTLSVEDTSSGPAQTWYRIDGGAVATYTAPVEFGPGGPYTLTYWSADAVGNTETSRTATGFSVDVDSPVVTFVSPAEGFVASASVTPTWTVSEPATVTATLNGAPYTPGTAVSADGTYSLTVIASDAAGNEATGTLGFSVDTIAPVTSDDAPVTWQAADPLTVSFAVVETGSPPATTRYSIDGGAWQAGASADVSGEGTHTVQYRSADVAGNTEATRSATVRIDTSAPETTATVLASYEETASIDLEATDALSGVALTRWTIDGGAARLGTSVVVTSSGDHTLRYASIDAAGNIEPTRTVAFRVTKLPVDYLGIAGASRYQTAIEASKRAYPDGAPTVIIATGANWPDALGASALAGAYDAPILLTQRDDLPPEVADEIVRLGATTSVVLGGTAAVSGAVADEILDTGAVSIQHRLAGATRYETAERVADWLAGITGADPGRRVIVTTGGGYADALAIAPLSFAKRWPIFLCAGDSLTPRTRAAIAAQDAAGAIVLGGERAVSEGIEDELVADFGPGGVTRLSGATRFGTAVAVAEHSVAVHGMTWDGLALTTGEKFPDALAGGPVQGRRGSVVLLTPTESLAAEVETALSENRDLIRELTYLGGTGSVAQSVRDRVDEVLRPF